MLLTTSFRQIAACCFSYQQLGLRSVLLANQRGHLHVLAAGRTMKLLHKTRLRSPIDCTPVAANGVLYVATARHLFAVRRK